MGLLGGMQWQPASSRRRQQSDLRVIGFGDVMNIAFYAPLKNPDHPVPSGDRQMARLLIKALTHAGHVVHVASTLRSFMPKPTPEAVVEIEAISRAEIERISALWRQTGNPDFWFTYHPYYKAPDLIGPALASRFRIPYATAEASYSSRRNIGDWLKTQALVVDAVKTADVNFCLTQRDRDGLGEIVPQAGLEMLVPFIDTCAREALPCPDAPQRLVTVAMMRRGDKFESYRMLAEALQLILDLPWTLSVVGDGDICEAVVQLFASLPDGRVEWTGQVAPDGVSALLQRGGIYVWPGFGEAYGLAYLEAQAAGLPVVAQKTAGVPEVVQDGVTGILTPLGDVSEFAKAIRRLLTDSAERQRMAAAAYHFVHAERSLQQATRVLDNALQRSIRRRQNGN
jgi:glycosyltransferase involved in cell wall biosynthesis